MMTRRRLLAVCGGILGAVVTTAAVGAASNLNHLEYVTFSGPVALPGVTLQAGSYSFQIADDNHAVVLVRERITGKPVFMGLTNRVERPNGIAAGRMVLGEARRGAATPILVWYMPEGDGGRQFIYR